MSDDYRDLALQMLADDEALLRERVRDLESTNEALRELLHEALVTLYRVNVQLDRAKRVIIQLRQALRDRQDSAAA